MFCRSFSCHDFCFGHYIAFPSSGFWLFLWYLHMTWLKVRFLTNVRSHDLKQRCKVTWLNSKVICLIKHFSKRNIKIKKLSFSFKFLLSDLKKYIYSLRTKIYCQQWRKFLPKFIKFCKIIFSNVWEKQEQILILYIYKAKWMVLQCINGVNSNPVEGRTKIWQLQNLILTLFGLIFRRIFNN